MADTDIIDIIDINQEIHGSADVQTAHNKKLMHRVVGIFVFDVGSGKLYIQKENKYGKLDLSAGGHVQKGETYEKAAQREMYEELGLRTHLKHIATFLPTEALLNHYWSIYKTFAPEDWKFEASEEVKSLEKKELSEIVKMVKSDPSVFTQGFINAFSELIRENG